MTRRKFTREFKESAVRLVRQRGYTPPQAAKSLGVDPASIRGWLVKYGGGEAAGLDGDGALRAENQRLRRENACLLMEREILKKRRPSSRRSSREVRLHRRASHPLADQRHVPAGFLLVRYEDLHADAAGQLQRVLDFVGITGVEDRVIRQAVEFASFQNMRRLERAGTATTSRLRPGDPSDPESYKTRRGKVGGYVDYLSPEQIALLDRRIAQELPALYGYGPQPAAEPVEAGPGTSSAQPVG